MLAHFPWRYYLFVQHPDLDVVIVTYNSAPVIGGLLDSLPLSLIHI